MPRVVHDQPVKAKPLDTIQRFLSRQFPGFLVQLRQRSGGNPQFTLQRAKDGSAYHIKIASHFVQHHQSPLEIETFLEHHGLIEKLQGAGSRPVIIDNAGVHFGKPEK
jgi:hypothetical protein